MGAKSRKVRLAYRWTNPETGKTHEPKAEVTVDDLTARDLIRAGRARAVDEPAQPAEKKGA